MFFQTWLLLCVCFYIQECLLLQGSLCKRFAKYRDQEATGVRGRLEEVLGKPLFRCSWLQELERPNVLVIFRGGNDLEVNFSLKTGERNSGHSCSCCLQLALSDISVYIPCLGKPKSLKVSKTCSSWPAIVACCCWRWGSELILSPLPAGGMVATTPVGKAAESTTVCSYQWGGGKPPCCKNSCTRSSSALKCLFFHVWSHANQAAGQYDIAVGQK